MIHIRALSLCLAPSAFSGTVANAHPHVWVTVETTVLYDAHKAVTGLKQRWTFDEMYSSYSLEGLDKNHDGVFDADSLKQLAKENMESLKDYKYFTEMTVEGEAVDFAPPIDYSVQRDAKKILHLTFTLPLKKPLAIGSLTLKYQVYDPEFYIALVFDEAKAVLLPAGMAGCSTSIEAPSGDPMKSKTWGAAYAATAVVTCTN